MPKQTITCPDCGLTLTVETTDYSATDFKYDDEEWKRLCKWRDVPN